MGHKVGGGGQEGHAPRSDATRTPLFDRNRTACWQGGTAPAETRAWAAARVACPHKSTWRPAHTQAHKHAQKHAHKHAHKHTRVAVWCCACRGQANGGGGGTRAGQPHRARCQPPRASPHLAHRREPPQRVRAVLHRHHKCGFGQVAVQRIRLQRGVGGGVAAQHPHGSRRGRHRGRKQDHGRGVPRGPSRRVHKGIHLKEGKGKFVKWGEGANMCGCEGWGGGI